MPNPNNPYFLEMKRIGHEYEERRAAHQAKKQTIADTYGYDSPEMEAWRTEKESIKFPFTTGQHKAYRAWEAKCNAIQEQNRIKTEEYNKKYQKWKEDAEKFLASQNNG